MRRTSKRRELSTAVGLTLSGRVFKRTFRQAINGERVISTLEHIGRQVGGRFIPVWDRAPTHRPRKVRGYLEGHPEVVVGRPPPYAPELNPEEYCHGYVKERIRNSTPATADELQVLVDRGFLASPESRRGNAAVLVISSADLYIADMLPRNLLHPARFHSSLRNFSTVRLL